jgi:plasmid stabilization system protein ParE
MKVVWTPLAEARVAQMIGSMRADRTGAAWRWLQGLLARIRGLARYPRNGIVVPEVGGPPAAAAGTIGEIYFAPCRIVYRVDARRIVILTVRAAGAHRKSARYEERPRRARRAARGRS